MARKIIVHATNRETVLESNPVNPALLASANWWFDVSWYGVLIAGVVATVATAATVIFLFIQYWSGNIRERHTDWRTSSLEVQTKRADADLERAKADIKIADARALEAQAELARFKAPRTILDSAKPALIAALSAFSGTNAAIYVLGEGPEPNSLAISIRDILAQADWDVLSWTWSGAGAATGIIVLPKPGSSGQIIAACDTLGSVLR